MKITKAEKIYEGDYLSDNSLARKITVEDKYEDKLAELKQQRSELTVRLIIEHLECGHVNNLALQGRKSGVCPQGCE